MTDFESKHLKQHWNLPAFVKNAPDYKKMFLREIEILKDENGKFALKIEGERYDESNPLLYKYHDFVDAYDAAWHFEPEFTICWPKETDGKWYDEDIMFTAFEPSSLKGQQHIMRNADGKRGVEYLIKDYEKWLDLNGKLTENSFTPDNFLEVFQWLDTHPDFWTLSYEYGYPMWETNKRVRTFDPTPYLDYQTKQIKWVCAAFTQIADESSDYDYGSIMIEDEPDMEVYGFTYEEVLLELAKNWFIEKKWQG